jgi:sugar/nucleoside kinase (ribokinase family)
VSERDIDLLVLGDCNPDLILAGADVVPAFGQAEKLLERAELTIGGSGAITACGAARLGLRTAIAAVVGDDRFGRFMTDSLRERDVDTEGVVVDPEIATGLTVILARPDDRAILTFPGAIAALRSELVDGSLLARARHVHVSAFFLQRALVPGLAELLATARSGGATTSLDPNWDPSGDWDGGLRELLPHLDMLLPNAAEARAIAGCDDVAGAVERLAERGPLVVVKLGADGAIAARAGEETITARAPAFEAIVDAVGAGDTFDAGFIAATLQGSAPADALALACACGALSTQGLGGTGAQPTLARAREAVG